MAKRHQIAPRIVAAPTPSSVTSVVLNPGERVRWIWTHTPAGSYVSGYSIVANKTRKNAKPRAG